MDYKHIIVTGGAGFVGSHIATRLRREAPVGCTITAFDNLKRRGSELNIKRLQEYGVSFVHGDIRAPEDFSALPAGDLLIECSAEPSVLAGINSSPGYLLRTNLVGTINCLEFCRPNKTDIIFLSTSRVYPIEKLNAAAFAENETRFEWLDDQMFPGISAKGVTEDFPVQGARSLYGATKLASEILIEEYIYNYGLRAIINRCGLLTGPWQMGKVEQGVISYWVASHLFETPLSYFGFGGMGKQTRDFLHVDDLCDLLIKQLNSFDTFNNQTLNIGGGRDFSTSLLELTQCCQQVIDKKVPVSSVMTDRDVDLRLYLSDCAKLYSLTDWRPQKDLHITVEDITRWLTDNKELLRSILQSE